LFHKIIEGACLKSRALFLDRDGVLNVDKTYVFRYADIEWMPGIFDLLNWAKKHHYKIIVLTNQSGIGRNYYTADDVNLLHKEMSEFLLTKGFKIDDWFFSDSLTDERRKPSPLMMLEAAKKHNIDLDNSIMVGDKLSDVLELRGPEYLLVKGSYPLKDAPADIKIFDSLIEIEKYLEKKL
jgi:D-glycero-D-manno-heptose 1,7-bisphosphate phosphatase